MNKKLEAVRHLKPSEMQKCKCVLDRISCRADSLARLTDKAILYK